MAKQPARFLSGLHPYTNQYFKITVYNDDSIRIERPWCLIDPRREWTELEESDWTHHKHLIALIERNTISDKNYKTATDNGNLIN